MPSNQTSFLPGGSVSEPRGAIGLQTAKLSPISGNVTGATAQLPAPVQSHPYSDMSAADLNAEPTGTLGLSAAERALMDGEDIMGPIVTWGPRPEKLFTSSISRREYHFTGQDKQLASGTSSNGKNARTEKLTKTRILVLRPNKEGVLVPRAIFCQCECPKCALSEGQVATGDQESAK